MTLAGFPPSLSSGRTLSQFSPGKCHGDGHLLWCSEQKGYLSRPEFERRMTGLVNDRPVSFLYNLGLTPLNKGAEALILWRFPVTNDKSCLVVILPPNLRLIFLGLVICHMAHIDCPAITAEEGGREGPWKSYYTNAASSPLCSVSVVVILLSWSWLKLQSSRLWLVGIGNPL